MDSDFDTDLGCKIGAIPKPKGKQNGMLRADVESQLAPRWTKGGKVAKMLSAKLAALDFAAKTGAGPNVHHSLIRSGVEEGETREALGAFGW